MGVCCATATPAATIPRNPKRKRRFIKLLNRFEIGASSFITRQGSMVIVNSTSLKAPVESVMRIIESYVAAGPVGVPVISPPVEIDSPAGRDEFGATVNV